MHVVSFFDLLIAISCDLLNEISSKLVEENRGIEFHNEETCSATCHGDDNKNLSFTNKFMSYGSWRLVCTSGSASLRVSPSVFKGHFFLRLV